VETWTWEQAAGRRLRRGHLLVPAGAGAAVDVVRSLGGVQAQVPAAAELGVGIRVDGLTRGRLRALVDEARLLTRTYAMRGTAYLLPTGDLPLYLAAMRQVRGGEDRWFAGFGLSREEAARLFGGLAGILDGRCLTRPELVEALREQVGDWVFERFDPTLGKLTEAAAYAGVLAYGPARGSTSTFQRPDQWGGRWSEVDGETALREVAARYLASFGPATSGDLARWLGIPAGPARELVASLAGRVRPVAVDGDQAWLPAHDPGPDGGAAPSVLLLPQYDAYVLGPGPADRVLPAAAKDLVRRRKRGRYEGAAGVPVLLLDGVVAGVWERRQRGRRVEVAVEPVRRLTARQREALEAAAERVARFDEAVPALTVLPAGGDT
jgi:DNA glycosylase AlkZ-like